MTASDGQNVRYYILFDNYTHGFALQAILKEEGIKNRIAPAPRAIQGDLTCGMSLLIEPEDLPEVERVIEERKPIYHAIRPLAGQINPRRDKYC
ncbi:MAG: DUF3343 domain-containing protein [Lachnospiraceae bacterium]|jgi:hypothetical protein|nr:DUF3343 domain-containing protein [Lachnospiraceae bacterium]